ncbi:helix-turn-helix domain-containing protein [Pseudomonas sp. UYIF39]|uniref:helix-turn-helix domain-containing protein n=1 Tax=Pseudomonas sp. UYIF39 TaxID=1630747 RepID=UPI00249E8C22|nr:helix-turn-helix domain-containing protein [Pseudomonas sp. UYIF39]MDI3357009.1 helix-turn-helix domain-containing protein [Pseudomonas sp. UYIF39]
MSTIIMSACWPLQGMSPAQKSVLISLSDNANDEGVCWPSIAKIGQRTCLAERTVQSAIKWLCSAGVLSVRERMGRSTMYTITPATFAPPQDMRPADAAGTPPQEAHPTPADAAPPPRSGCTQNRNRTAIDPSVEPPSSFPALVGQGAGEVIDPEQEKRTKAKVEADRQEACRGIWTSYAAAYFDRYQTEPVRNATVNTQINNLLKRLGADEARFVAAYYVSIQDAYLIRSCHDIGSLLAKAEAYRTQWATNTQVNGTTAKQMENTQANMSTAEQAKAMLRKRGNGNA